MTRSTRSGAALLLACMLAGCGAHDGAAASIPTIPADSIVLEIDGKAFQAGCANGSPGTSFLRGATCGTAGPGAGPIFHSLDCADDASQAPPIYFIGALFRNFDPAGVTDERTFDLADPAHEDFVTVMMGYMDLTRSEYQYCTAPPPDSSGAAYPPSSGTVTLHRLVPDPGAPPGVYLSEAEVTDAVIPSPDGGPTVKIVAAHLYFQ